MKKFLTPTILLLSLVSLFTDIASEMLYPVMPIYLQEIGFSILFIGIIEGLAEAVSGISKGYFGSLADQSGRKLPFVRFGYTLSAIAKPLIIASSGVFWVFFMRTLDRFGKGIRSSARDAILSAESCPETKARVFGFHRALDTLGAALGPLIALLYLYYNPGEYKLLFLIALLPGLISISFLGFLKETRVEQSKNISYNFFNFLRYWKQSPVLYKKLVVGLLVFALINSSDMFLILKLKENGISDYMAIMLYIIFNASYALFSYPAGIFADKMGLKIVLISGILIFSFVYFMMAFAENLELLIVLFVLYGLFAASTEGISKAWISNISDKGNTATAIGTYNAFQSICTMLASLGTGLIALLWSLQTAFIVSAIIALFVAFYLLIISKKSA